MKSSWSDSHNVRLFSVFDTVNITNMKHTLIVPPFCVIEFFLISVDNILKP